MVYGTIEGLYVGFCVGSYDGLLVGLYDGLYVGISVGSCVGVSVGLYDGLYDGISVGSCVGWNIKSWPDKAIYILNNINKVWRFIF